LARFRHRDDARRGPVEPVHGIEMLADLRGELLEEEDPVRRLAASMHEKKRWLVRDDDPIILMKDRDLWPGKVEDRLFWRRDRHGRSSRMRTGRTETVGDAEA